MPLPGHRTATLREQVYQKLRQLAAAQGLTSINDTVALLLREYEEKQKLENTIEKRLAKIEYLLHTILEKLEQGGDKRC